MKTRNTTAVVASTTSRNDVELDALAVALADLLERLVDERIAAALTARDVRVDAFRSTGPLPPDAPSRRAFVEACRSGRVAGAEKVGRVWTCSREAWHRARASRRLRLVAPVESDTQRADEMIAGAGFRLTRGSR